MTDNVSQAFMERMAKLRAEKAAHQPSPEVPVQPTPQAGPAVREEDIPDVEDSLTLSPEEQSIDEAIAAIGIVDAYNRWSGKKPIPLTVKVEGYKVSCPNPLHSDEHASAWINTDKNLWNCGGCEQGGDRWDLAAWHYGYPVPGYKDKVTFRELRKRIAQELGFRVIKGLAGTYVIREESDNTGQDTTDTPAAAQDQPASQTDTQDKSDISIDPTVLPGPIPSTVAMLPAAIAQEMSEEDRKTAINAPTFDWLEILDLCPRTDTFLHEWMASTTKDTCPEEYHFWTGMMALGFAVGRHRVLRDEPAVIPNLFVCLVGPSGTGKSKAKRHLGNVLREAVPFDQSHPAPNGTKITATPASGEVFVELFQHQIADPTDPKKLMGYAPIRGYIDYDEMADLMSRSSRLGSTLKTQLMQAADAPHEMSTASRTGGTSYALEPFAQVITTTQNRSLQGLISSKDDSAGFINRWVFVTGRPKQQVFLTTGTVDLSVPTKALRSIWTWSIGSKKEMTYDPDALVEMERFVSTEVWPMIKRADENTAMLNRLELLVKKLSVLFAVNEKLETIPLHVVQMIRKLYPYLLQAYGVVYEALGNSESADYQDRIKSSIARYYDRNKKFPTANNISKSLPPRYRELKLIRDNLKLLVEVGVITEIAPEAGKRGQPTMRYALAI